MSKTWVKVVFAMLPAAFILGVWEAMTTSNEHFQFLLGSPSGIGKVLWEWMISGELFRHFGVTLFEATAGLAVGVATGTGLGLALWKSPVLRWCSRPYLMAVGAVPMVAMGPVLVFWMGTGVGAKILIAALCTAPVAFAQADTGVRTANRELLEMSRTFGVPSKRVFFSLVAPSAIIWILASLRLNVGLALLGAFSGEFLSSREGLGHIIIVAEGLYHMNGMWAGIVGIIAAALLLHSLAIPLENWARRYTVAALET